MLYARDFRRWGREGLKGHWIAAVFVCLVGGLLSGGIDMISGVLNTGATGNTETDTLGMMELAANDAWPMMVTVTVASLLLAIVIGGAISLGMAHYFTNITAHRPSKFTNLFSRFSVWHKGIWMNIVVAFFVILWSLLGVLPVTAVAVWIVTVNITGPGTMIVLMLLILLGCIPGAIATYRYTMIPYLIAEFPELTVMDALRESKRLMQGNKWRFFCLQMSFFGWALLVVLFTAGIGILLLNPYIQAASAAFYLDVTGRKGLRYMQPEE